MAPSLEAHGELAAAFTMEIGGRVKPPCRVISEAGVLIPDRADTYYIADLAVTCAPRESGRRMVVEPVLVVEILSPSTGQVDRWRKVADCRTASRSGRSWWLSATSEGLSCSGDRRMAGGSRT